MDKTTLTDFFEELETTKSYSGYFCSIAGAISIVVLGSLCGLKNVSQIHQWANSERVKEFLKEKFAIHHIPCYYWLLVLLKLVKADTLNRCLTKWAAQFMPENRDRIETRTAYTTDDVAWLNGKGKWKNLTCVGAIKTEFERNGRKAEEWHYYISSRKLTAVELLRHARMEWAVETMHWLLDVHYGEDYCRIENRTAQQNRTLMQLHS